MNPENIFKKIEEDSPENHEKALKNKFWNIQLEYAQRLFEKKIPSPVSEINTEGMTFEQILDEMTDFSLKIREAYNQRTGKQVDSDENYQEFKRVKDEVFNKAKEIYENRPSDWISKMDEIVLISVQKLPQGEKPFQSDIFKGMKAGLLEYEVVSLPIEDLEKYGINKDDECVKIHFAAFFKQKINQDTKLSNVFLSDSFRKLAEEILKNHPNVKAIISESWLLDTPLAKKIGFHTYPSSNENVFHGSPFWGQFIDQNGQINEDRAREFLETGNPSHIVKSGYIPIDEFLAKYGPK